MHKAVIFDLGKTVINFDFAPAYRALEGFCPCAGPEMTRRIMATGLGERFEAGLIGPREFFDQLAATLDLRLSYEAFLPIWNSIFKETLIPEEMLERLAARYRLVLLSNTNILHFEAPLREYPILRHFKDKVLSYEVHAMKPNPAIFQAAIACAGCAPGECFYTDDVPAFVEAARGLGMDAEEFRGLEKLELDLRSRGIEWE